MAFTSISSAIIEAGKAIKEELWTLVKNNFDDHESRIAVVEVGASQVPIFDETVYSAVRASTLTGVLFFKASRNVRVTKVQVQIFEKGTISSGNLTIDAKKSINLNPAGFSSIMSTQPTINYATDPNYASNDGVINSALNTVLINQFIRIDVTALPADPVSKFRVLVYGELV